MSEFLGANMNEMEDYESSINFDEMDAVLDDDFWDSYDPE